MAGYSINVAKSTSLNKNWGVSVNLPATSSIVNEVTGAASNIKNAVGTYVDNLTSRDVSYENDAQDLLRLGSGLLDSAQSLIQQKVDKLVELWKTPQTVTVGSLIGNIAPYVTDPKDLGKQLVGRIDNLVATLTGTSAEDDDWLGLLKDLGQQYLDEALSNPDVTNAIGSLGAVQEYTALFNTLTDSIELIKEILDTIAPFKKPISILVDIVSAWMNPPALEKAGQTLSEYVQSCTAELKKWALRAIEDFVFGIELTVPSLLVTSFKALSFKEAKDAYELIEGTNWAKSWLESSDKYKSWAEIKQTTYPEFVTILSNMQSKLDISNWADGKIADWTNGKLSVDKLTSYVNSAYLSLPDRSTGSAVVTDGTNTSAQSDSEAVQTISVGRVYDEESIRSISSKVYSRL